MKKKTNKNFRTCSTCILQPTRTITRVKLLFFSVTILFPYLQGKQYTGYGFFRFVPNYYIYDVITGIPNYYICDVITEFPCFSKCSMFTNSCRKLRISKGPDATGNGMLTSPLLPLCVSFFLMLDPYAPIRIQ